MSPLDTTQRLVRAAIDEAYKLTSTSPLEALVNIKYARRVSAVHHLITVAEATAQIVESLCDTGRCPRPDPKEAVVEAFLLGLAHDYAKTQAHTLYKRLAHRILREAREMKLPENTIKRLEKLANDPARAASTVETGPTPVGGRDVPIATIHSAMIADYLASQEKLLYAINGLPSLFQESPPSKAPSNRYERAANYLRRQGLQLTYIQLPEHRPHEALLAQASAGIIGLTGATPLISYPDGIILVSASNLGKIDVEEISRIIENIVVQKPSEERVKTAIANYAERSVCYIARVAVAAALLDMGTPPEVVAQEVLGEATAKRVEALKALRRCVKEGQCRGVSKVLPTVAGQQISHNRFYIESLQNILLVDSIILREQLKTIKEKISERCEQIDIKRIVSNYGVDPDRLVAAVMIYSYSKDPERLSLLASILGLSKPPKDAAERIIWALRAAERVSFDKVLDAIAAKPPVGTVKVRVLAEKLARVLVSPLVEDRGLPVSGDGESVRCLVCQIDAPLEETVSLSEAKTALQNSGMFQSFESWLNTVRAFDNVDNIINNRRFSRNIRVCRLCFYEATNNLFPPMMSIVLGPPIGALTLDTIYRRVSEEGTVENIIVDMFGARILVPLYYTGRPRAKLSLAGETVYGERRDGDVVKSALEKLAHARVFPLFAYAPVARASLGGEPHLVTGLDGTRLVAQMPELDFLVSLEDERGERPLAPHAITLYYTASEALRAWSRAAAECRGRASVFPKGNKSGVVLDMFERIRVFHGRPGDSRLALFFSLAGLGAYKATGAECKGAALRRAARLVSPVLEIMPRLEEQAGAALGSASLRGVRVEVSRLAGLLKRYGELMFDVVKNRTKPWEASPHEVTSLLRGLDDAVRHYARRRDADEAVALVAARALQRLEQVYKCSPKSHGAPAACREILGVVEGIAREVIEDLDKGRLHIGEAGRLLKDIYHLAYYYYVVYLVSRTSKGKPGKEG